MFSNKENRLNFYAHKPLDHFTTYFDGLDFSWQCSGFHERPPHLQSGLDWFGVYWEFDQAQQAFIPDHIRKPILEDICDWREVIKWPDLDSINWNEATFIDEVDKKDRKNNPYIMMLGMGPFERLHSLMGFEGALISLVSEQEECKAYLEKWTEWKCKLIHYISEYYEPDIIQFHDDSGTQNSTFYSPETWENLIKPCWTACCKEIKKHGIYAELHSCGKGQEFFKDIEDCGFDTLFIQSINDYDFIRKHTGGRVGIITSDSTNELEAKAQTGGITVKEVRDSIYNLIKTHIEGSPNGYDYIPLITPIPSPEGITEDTILTTPIEVMGVANDWVQQKSKEFTKLMLEKQKNLKNS
jgi:hypothetical protein